MRARLLWAPLMALLLAAPQLEGQQEPVVVYLVRHAETLPDGSRDPALSEAGLERAAELSRVLGDVALVRVMSTELRRTRETAGPIAERRGLTVELYDPFDLAPLVAELRRNPGHHLVVGHSNTTPAFVEALGGEPGPAISESEYDRLYILTLSPDGSASTSLLRYGAPSGG